MSGGHPITVRFGHHRYLIASRWFLRLMPRIHRNRHVESQALAAISHNPTTMRDLRSLYYREHNVTYHASDQAILAWLASAFGRGQIVVLELYDASISSKQGASPRLKSIAPNGRLHAGKASRRMGPQKLSDLSVISKMMEVVVRMVPKLSRETPAALKQMISPQALEFLAGTFAAWALSHAIGLGEEIDLLLLGIGYALIGSSAIEGCELVYEGSRTAMSAKDSQALDVAADKLARGITILGVNTLLVLLSKVATSTAAESEDGSACAVGVLHRQPQIGIRRIKSSLVVGSGSHRRRTCCRLGVARRTCDVATGIEEQRMLGSISNTIWRRENVNYELDMGVVVGEICFATERNSCRLHQQTQVSRYRTR